MKDEFTPLTGSTPNATGILLQPDIPICQGDFPLDRYDEAFRPYAEEYLSLPDRTPESVLPWLDRYVLPAKDHFGDELLLLAHFYMGGEIVKLVERYGGKVSDSYMLAMQAQRNPEKRIIVESAVHFMAETVAILANPDQAVWITNPRAGCTMEMMAKGWMVDDVLDQLANRFGDEFSAVSYMNTSGQLKALAGRTGGAVCTSSNAHLVVADVLKTAERVLFLPDEHLGRNTATRLGIGDDEIVTLPHPSRMGAGWSLCEVPNLDRAKLILWGGYCGVHTLFTTDHVAAWHERGYDVHVHPECTREVVQAADGSGSTNYLWNLVSEAPRGAKLVIGTEGHFVRNAMEFGAQRGVEVRHLSDQPSGGTSGGGCGCATMSRNDPPHLAGMLDLLRRGNAPEANRVLPGDEVNERTGVRTRLDFESQRTLVTEARLALERMIEVTERAS